MTFPDTKYMGSKQNLLPFITQNTKNLKFNTALDAFSGSGCVAYAFKEMGKRVLTNDFLKFSYHTTRALVENNSTTLSDQDITELLRKPRQAPDFVRRTFNNLYFDQEDCEFLDNLWANASQFNGSLKRSLVLAAAARACMKKRPRGIFTFTGKKGWDGRKDLKLTMRDQFLQAVKLFNQAVFSNGKQNKSFCKDVFDLDPKDTDLVYIDTPYISPYSDCDYTRRYHFVEGYSVYWKGLEVLLIPTHFRHFGVGDFRLLGFRERPDLKLRKGTLFFE
ncbi:MAG: DNA adenine methylase [Candidatus Omnitrophica bacterium]|nr:DNA adenine methylase [Candidatus Omnitrophota bacterium]